MLKFLTSLTFLYAFSITVLILYGLIYYRNFSRNRYRRKSFPVIFLLVSLACFSFLYFNIHASLSLRTFSNLDHQFIRHDGFLVARDIELGRTDTGNNRSNSFSRFVLEKRNEQVGVSSSYSEEPFYNSTTGSYKLLSVHFPALRHSVSFRSDTISARIEAITDNSFGLTINNGAVFRPTRKIVKGMAGWDIFKDDPSFINSSYYTNEDLVTTLKNILLLRDDVSRNGGGALSFFISGRLYQVADRILYDEKNIRKEDLAFQAEIPDKSLVAWGIGFLDNNRNQYHVNYLGADSFTLINRYPVAYPMIEENDPGGERDWSAHPVNKFLVSDSRDLLNMPPVFGEGFLFAPFNGDSTIDFSPVLLSYRKGGGNNPLILQARFMDNTRSRMNEPEVKKEKLILPAKSSGFAWVFSIRNSFDWNFGTRYFTPGVWQLLLFGSLAFFFVLVIGSAMVKPGQQLSWIWQLLTCVTFVLLTTRYFLYWRYKSFPPYEGMDLPSLQQLNSFWNFGIIILTTVIMAVIFGFGFLKYLYFTLRKKSASLLRKTYRGNHGSGNLFTEERIADVITGNNLVKKAGVRIIFFGSWLLILLGSGAWAVFNNFDPTTSRHLAIGLILAYFIFLFISYRHSPLVASAEKSWWAIHTGNTFDLIINNPVKVLLSVSLLFLFGVVDIGFAIVFLNFLLFNEAFLCINYAIAGLSAGSKKNATLFGMMGGIYLLAFALNLMYGPYIFRYLLSMPRIFYTALYILFAIAISVVIGRLLHRLTAGRKLMYGIISACFFFAVALFIFPKERILKKAAVTRYRIDVMTMPVDRAIETAYEEGKTYEPVIRAAQNQWFINTFIYEKNNPDVNKAGFHLLPHAPQNKGARYNAQATDLVASRFFIAEHGRWSVLLYVLLLLLPATLLASFYKLYPDFTNRINKNYPAITVGFSLLNYLLMTALLVILAATGRYIFFGQDLPFGSILSKQSILFPSMLIVAIAALFRKMPLEYYPNKMKMVPGAIVFTGLAILLFQVKPVYNKNKEFNVADTGKDMDAYIELRLQPLLDYVDTSRATRKFSAQRKDQLFTDTLRKLIAAGFMGDAGSGELSGQIFLEKEIERYAKSGFSQHLDQRRILYLDLYSGRPQLAVNDNYFRIEPPPHLLQSWTGNVFSDTSNYNISLWDEADGSIRNLRMSSCTNQPAMALNQSLQFKYKDSYGENLYGNLCLVNRSASSLKIKLSEGEKTWAVNDTLELRNPARIRITDSTGKSRILITQPDAFMKNLYVNGNRYYVYPMGRDFIWAKNFAESVASDYAGRGENTKDAFVSLNPEMTDSLSLMMQVMMNKDTAYKKGAEYGICIADGNGRLVTMVDFIKDLNRPDPNDKAGFNTMIRGESGYISQSLLRKEIGNINLLRLNPGPGSTLKPIVFTSIASQLNMDWDAFGAEGFSQKQKFFGGEKVAEYDFEKNNGRISNVVDYLKYSDNYYHSNVLLLGSYSRQGLTSLLAKYFATKNPEANMHWPYFSYQGRQYWLDGFENWPGYFNGRANFGSDSSFLSIGLFKNYGINTDRVAFGFDRFPTRYDSLLFKDAYHKSGFILPEYALFDQKGTGMDNSKPNEVFMASFRGHVKGSSQVMIPPAKMAEAFGRMVSQNRNYVLTLNPYAKENAFSPFYVDNGVSYSHYLSLVREKVFEGMKQALYGGTATGLGSLLKNGSPYYYYAKTGTTGDDAAKTKSKLFAIIISKKDITDPDFNFRKNKFYTIYFTSQNGPAKQNEEFQAEVIKYVQQSPAFRKYMGEN